MGKKSTINLLPKAERTHGASKITVRPREAIPQTPANPLPHQPRKPASPIPALDDESLRIIFRYAGTLTTLRASRVNTQWHRVACEVLLHTRYVEVSRLFPTLPTPMNVHTALASFANLETLVVRNWQYNHVFPTIADELPVVNLPNLKRVGLFNVHVTPNTAAALVEIPSVRFLEMGEHDSINQAVVAAMVRSQKLSLQPARDPKTPRSYLLDRLTFKKATCIGGEDITKLSVSCVAQETIAMACPKIRKANLSAMSLSTSRSQNIYEMYSFANCQNLYHVDLKMGLAHNDVSTLNLSQCKRLISLTFRFEDQPSGEDGIVLSSDLRELNLSSCNMLRDVSVGMDLRAIRFPKLEKLILFGTRSLRTPYLDVTFGLGSSIPVLPNLTRLDLNGSSIERLILNQYTHLAWVDVSGSHALNLIDVRDCWSLRSFAVFGKHAPLQAVSMVLPVSCTVLGCRRSWRWETQGSHIAISYP